MSEAQLRRSIRRTMEDGGVEVTSGGPIPGPHSDLYQPEDDLRIGDIAIELKSSMQPNSVVAGLGQCALYASLSGTISEAVLLSDLWLPHLYEAARRVDGVYYGRVPSDPVSIAYDGLTVKSGPAFEESMFHSEHVSTCDTVDFENVLE